VTGVQWLMSDIEAVLFIAIVALMVALAVMVAGDPKRGKRSTDADASATTRVNFAFGM